MSHLRSRLLRQPRFSHRHRPRGVAVVLVLGLLAITLAISYATLRGQATTSQLAQNNSRALDARVAAQSGLAAAIRKISENAWAGVDVPLAANITNHSWYQVTFTTGDTKLTSTDPQYPEFPFRLTIDSMGYASDPQNPAVRAEHHSRCIVQLMRKKLTAAPANWNTVTSNTVYQYDEGKDPYVQFPVRIDGTATLMGRLQFVTEYPGIASARDQYLSDLNARRLAGKGDDRPLPPITYLRGLATAQDATTIGWLTSRLAIDVREAPLAPGAPVSHPGGVSSYRLYPGGKPYQVTNLEDFGSPLQNVTVGPDPINNPLGIFRAGGSIDVENNVHITGTIINGGSLDLESNANNVTISSFNLPPLYGSSQTYQLPAALIADDLKIDATVAVQINGAAIVWDRFELKSGGTNTNFALTGNLIVKELILGGRNPWKQTTIIWNTDKNNFTLNLLLPLTDPNREAFFPDYQQRWKAFVVKPTLTFLPNSSGVKPHWHDWSQPIYQADPADPGLKWEVVRWEENL